MNFHGTTETGSKQRPIPSVRVTISPDAFWNPKKWIVALAGTNRGHLNDPIPSLHRRLVANRLSNNSSHAHSLTRKVSGREEIFLRNGMETTWSNEKLFSGLVLIVKRSKRDSSFRGHLYGTRQIDSLIILISMKKKNIKIVWIFFPHHLQRVKIWKS